MARCEYHAERAGTGLIENLGKRWGRAGGFSRGYGWEIQIAGAGDLAYSKAKLTTKMSGKYK